MCTRKTANALRAIAIAKQRIPVIKAWCEGKDIQIKDKDRWKDWTNDFHPSVVGTGVELRIKPQPRTIYRIESVSTPVVVYDIRTEESAAKQALVRANEHGCYAPYRLVKYVEQGD